MTPTSACQHGYMWHSAELICNKNNQCHLEYARELLFNRLQSEICLEILHANNTVGLIKFTKQSVDFKCSKITEFFTRQTRTHIYHVKRCPQAGSCTTDKCDTISPNETIPELQYTTKFPGYSGCLNSCGGILCGCFMPLPTCWFYRVAHKPLTTRVFEVIKCPQWNPTIQLEVEITLTNNTEIYNHSFKPYVTETLSNLNITITSIQKPIASLTNLRFLVASDRSYLLPHNIKLPVGCNNYTQALEEFSSCTNRVRCNCENSVHNCQCPEDSIRNLHGTEYVLPVSTPYARITAIEKDIFANSEEEELVLRIEYKILQNTAELISNQECSLQVSRLTGYYDCALGAHFTATCKSSTHNDVTVTCDSQQFVIKCGPSNEENNIVLHFEHPVVHEQFNAHCTEIPTKFLVNGTLHYHISGPQGTVFDLKSHGISLRHQWFKDISLPNIDPLINTIKSHWKLTLAAIGSITVLAAITYLAGPMVILLLANATCSLVALVAKGIWKAVSLLITILWSKI